MTWRSRRIVPLALLLVSLLAITALNVAACGHGPAHNFWSLASVSLARGTAPASTIASP